MTALTRHQRCALSYIHDRRVVAVRAQPARHARAVRVCVRDAHARERSTSRPSFNVRALLCKVQITERSAYAPSFDEQHQAVYVSRRQLPQRRDYSKQTGQPAPEGPTC